MSPPNDRADHLGMTALHTPRPPSPYQIRRRQMIFETRCVEALAGGAIAAMLTVTWMTVVSSF